MKYTTDTTMMTTTCTSGKPLAVLKHCNSKGL
jgi:hypothetical protein